MIPPRKLRLFPNPSGGLQLQSQRAAAFRCIPDPTHLNQTNDLFPEIIKSFDSGVLEDAAVIRLPQNPVNPSDVAWSASSVNRPFVCNLFDV